jgi:hypothetical protein
MDSFSEPLWGTAVTPQTHGCQEGSWRPIIQTSCHSLGSAGIWDEIHARASTNRLPGAVLKSLPTGNEREEKCAGSSRSQ